MKKGLPLLILFVSIIQVVFAQSIKLTGSVKDERGNPIRFAFLTVKQTRFATYSDSLGNFSLSANPGATLLVKNKGYLDQQLPINAQTDFQIVLKPDGNAANAANNASLGNADSRDAMSGAIFSSASIDKNYTFGEGDSFRAHKKAGVHGSRYLFEDWAHGYVISSTDSLYPYNNYLFNYDKIGGGLLLTSDLKNVLEISRSQLKSFTLFNGDGTAYVFEQNPDIDKVRFVQVLSSGKSYKIYKLTTTRFIKSDFVNNGFTTHGNDFDEFKDDFQYYVLNLKTNQLQKLALKKKAIKEAFAGDAEKVNKFMSENSSDMDDTYLGKLGNVVNN
jgi:hypothetical protein